jgi:uncharacterized protein (DUF1501 family)
MTNETPMSRDRRQWLRRAMGLAGAPLMTGTGLGLLSLAGNLALPARPARAADYKALVSVFLYGGNDGMNTVTPTDAARHAAYAAVRGPLALPRGALLGLSGTDLGLHPALSAIAPMWDQGRMATVLNVGPLWGPSTKAELRAAAEGSDLVPDALFSHSDQQVLWETSDSQVHLRAGWGGRMAEVMGLRDPVISLVGNHRFGVGELNAPLVLPGPGELFGVYGVEASLEGWPAWAGRNAALRGLYEDAQGHQLADAFAAQQRHAFEVSARLGALVERMPGEAGSVAAIDNAFVPLMDAQGRFRTGLAARFYQTAKLIADAAGQGGRQIYMLSQDGYDTHGQQISTDALSGTHAELLRELGDALAAFHGALAALGLDAQVTTFTQSEFGRTFVPNNSAGTDHAWGGMQLVLGGAVQGRGVNGSDGVFGRYPELVAGGPDDIGLHEWERQGRWIPTMGVDQYAGTLLRWFGATSGQIAGVLPHLSHWGQAPLPGFL